MTDINTVLVFKSIDVKNYSNNKQGNFITKINPEIILDSNQQHFIALDHISMFSSWHNIRSEYNNDTLKVSKDGGSSYITIKFPNGAYDFDDINKFIQSKIGLFTPGDKTSGYGIDILFDLTSYKIYITLIIGWILVVVVVILVIY